MARPLATNHEEKRQKILLAATRVFARHGFDKAATSAIAAEAGVSKALVYHYYDTKQQMLLDIIRDHIGAVIARVETIDDPEQAPRERLRHLVMALLDCFSDADDQHQIQINELRRLPEAKSAELVDMERQLVRHVAEVLVAAMPRLGTVPAMVKPVTMSVLGILNWHGLWFRDDGAITRKDYADLVTNLVLDGAESAVLRRTGSAPG